MAGRSGRRPDPGVKYITTKLGWNRKCKVEHMELGWSNKSRASGTHCTWIYTGTETLCQKSSEICSWRIYHGRPESIEALKKCRNILAVLMRYELEQGDWWICKLLNRHWEVSKKLDAGSTNTCIDQIFNSWRSHWWKAYSGVGGGGFLRYPEKGVAKKEEHLREKTRNVFQDSV